MVNYDPVKQLRFSNGGVKNSMSFETNSTDSVWEEQNLETIEAGEEPAIKNSGASIFGPNFEIVEMTSENILSALHLSFSLPRSRNTEHFLSRTASFSS